MRASSREPARTFEAMVAIACVGLADDRLGWRGETKLTTRQVMLIHL